MRGRDRRRKRCSGCAVGGIVSLRAVRVLVRHVVVLRVAGYMTHDPVGGWIVRLPKKQIEDRRGWDSIVTLPATRKHLVHPQIPSRIYTTQ